MATPRLITTLAKRSIFRNTRRTLLTILLISCSLIAILFTDAFTRGLLETMIKLSTQTFMGEAQIHQKGFREANDVDIYIKRPYNIYNTLSQLEEVTAFSPRTISGAMISSSENVSAVAIYGIEATKESQVSKLKSTIIHGEYLSGGETEILIGSELADLLEVDLGDRLVVTVSQAHGGDLSQSLYRVSGIFSFNERAMDTGVAFVNLAQGQTMLNIAGVHEIALRLKSVDHADDTALPLWSQLNTENLETLNWRQLTPQLDAMLSMSGYSTMVVAIIMYILVALGLINTMFMSIYERHTEFGILLAIGTKPKQLFYQIVMEGFFIGSISVFLGVVLGRIIGAIGSKVGIDYSEMEVNGVSLNEPIYLIVDNLTMAHLSLSILLITVISCVYPAFHAAKLTPSMAMRKTL